MDRRKFLGWFSLGAVVAYLPVFLAACSGKNNEATTPQGAEKFIPVGTLTDLQQKGQLSQGEILVIPSPSAPKEVIAVNPSCTHAGCAVSWDKQQTAFICPCHGSQFGSDGKVLQGPADKPLTTYTTKLEGDKILVKTT